MPKAETAPVKKDEKTDEDQELKIAALKSDLAKVSEEQQYLLVIISVTHFI